MREKIKEIIAQTLGLDPTDIEEEASLRADLGVGAQEATELLEALKTELGIEIPPEEINGIEKVGELLDLAEQYSHEEL